MSLRPACPGTEIARAPHSRRARDLRGVGSPEGSGLFGRRPAARKEAGAAPAVSRCMGQQGAVARGGGLGRPPSRSARQAERARGPGGSRQAAKDICTYCGAGLHFVFGTRLPTGILGSVGAWLSAVPFFSSASAPVRHFSIWRITRSLLAGGFVSVGFPSLRAGPGGSLAGRRHGHIRCW